MEEPPLISLMLQHRHALLAFLCSLTRDRDLAEEIFQEVGLAIAQHARVGTRVERFLPWALAIARRQVSAYFRAKQRRPTPLHLSEELADTLIQAFEENERLLERSQLRYKLLHQCLDLLAGRGRQVVVERFHNNRSIGEIAALLAWKPESVKVTLSRARKQLVDCVAKKLHDLEAD